MRSGWRTLKTILICNGNTLVVRLEYFEVTPVCRPATPKCHIHSAHLILCTKYYIYHLLYLFSVRYKILYYFFNSENIPLFLYLFLFDLGAKWEGRKIGKFHVDLYDVRRRPW